MATQSELELEEEFIKDLESLNYTRASVTDIGSLYDNLKIQLEAFNNVVLSDSEFKRILNHLDRGDRFSKAKKLRDRYELRRDDETVIYIKFLDSETYSNNLFQVTNQIKQSGVYDTRYDVTILVNGLPLVQIELKRSGVELKAAFNQVGRYQKAFSGSIFEYLQVFVISNRVDTKYFANNPKQSFKQTFYWTDRDNKKITDIKDFADIFFDQHFLIEMIGEYIVLAEAEKIAMILRPYQYFAVKAIEKRVETSTDNGYIWHTTGSGKTLTSFKTSQILQNYPDIERVLFVVDRRDLDTQTVEEFNSFSEDSVDGTNNTRDLVKKLLDPRRKLIVTTIQKLDRVISSDRYSEQLKDFRDGRIVIIFDECHRSQFGKTHAGIKNFFTNAQLFGFTGTPIFAENNVSGVTTTDVFDKQLHQYVITDAISDNNVLGFSIEYVGKYKAKVQDSLYAEIDSDIEIPGIDTKEVLESIDRLGKITNYILADWKRKTKRGRYNAMLAVPSIEVLKKYYTLFKQSKESSFRIATIFSFNPNEELNDYLSDEQDISDNMVEKLNLHSREFLDECIEDFNRDHGTNHSSKNYYQYYKDLQKKVKSREIDLVIVVNMFLTGFDAKRLNTLYVDKNLRYHGLIQAYSRTNRTLDSDKTHGNIVAFRNLKKNTDEALALYGDKDAREVVFKPPFEVQEKEFSTKLEEFKNNYPEIESINDLKGETEKLEFVKSFRDLLRIKANIETYSEFDFDALPITEQEFEDYTSKYYSIYEEAKKPGPQLEPILYNVDFEIELILKDTVDYDYIIKLIAGLIAINSDVIRNKKKEDILKHFDRDPKLAKKKELIKKFIEDSLPSLPDGANIESEFEYFWTKMKERDIESISREENMSKEDFKQLLSTYLYSGRMPKGSEITRRINRPVPILERSSLVNRVSEAVKTIVDIFEW